MGKSQAKKAGASSSAQELSAYKKQETWIKWAGMAILILVLLLFLLMGYASDWWQGANKDALRQFAPTSTTGTPNDTSGQNTSSTGGGTNTTRESNSSTTTNTTTNNNTTTPAPTPTPTPTPTPQPDPSLIEILTGINTGDTIDEAIALAESKGVDVDCRTELLVIRVCDITVGDDTITIKGLVSDDIITGITDNF